MVDLNRAATFVRVVEAGNFTRAAEQLHLPTSSVSRSVARLEDELGVSLLERTTRRVTPTEAGRAFFERARDALAGLEEANSLALDAALEAHGVVRLAVPMELAGNAGMMMASFLDVHPRIRVELTFTSRGAELVGDLVDLAVAVGRLPDSALVSKRIGTSTEKLYAAPSYLERTGAPTRVADLRKHSAVAARAVGGLARWELEGPRGAEHIDVPARIVGEGYAFLTDAAIAGLGIALLPSWFGDRAVHTGTLVNVLPRFSTNAPLHVLSHASRHMPRRVALVRDHLMATLAHRCVAHAVPTLEAFEAAHR